jgi:flagellar motility protein MotE (MotC chaperone)
MLRIPAPRLLPATIATMTVLLVVKCGILAQAVLTDGARPDTAMVAAANAASTERGPEPTPEHEKPPAGKTPPPAQKPVAATPSVPEGPPPVSESERALLQDLRTRRKELDARAATVATRESVLTATEQKLSDRVTELQTLQKQLETLDAAQKQKQDAGWQGLVKVYESMKPKDAATIFNDLSMPVLLQVVDRMKDAKAAAIMASMNPDRARDVTTELAQLRTGRATGQQAGGQQAGGQQAGGQQSAVAPKANPAGG